jgi:hypothetical protein
MAARSYYDFDRQEDCDDACSALSYHLPSDWRNKDVWKRDSYTIGIDEECSDIAKAASICREHGGKYRDPY